MFYMRARARTLIIYYAYVCEQLMVMITCVNVIKSNR